MKIRQKANCICNCEHPITNTSAPERNDLSKLTGHQHITMVTQCNNVLLHITTTCTNANAEILKGVMQSCNTTHDRDMISNQYCD